jgi:tRNA (adenine57-N1/adenine58-N1)-methyltransferase
MTNIKTFEYGNKIILKDARGRKYMTMLEKDRSFQCHMGIIYHETLIGSNPGSWHATNKGNLLFATFPTYNDFITLTNRETQIIYPKDIATILNLADIQSGDFVIEGGMGSGTLTSALLNSVGPTGTVISYEINPKVVPLATRNVEFLSRDPGVHTVKQKNIYRSLPERNIDKIILDLPEPWKIVTKASRSLRPGGIFVAFLPTILQAHKLVSSLHENILFTSVETIEVLHRTWHITKQSARPSHRMVGHTGFLTTAVRCESRHQDKLPCSTVSPRT